MGIPALVAVEGDAQGAFDVSTTVTLSELLNVDELKVGLLVPTFAPFTFHWYVGVVPPLVGVAVKVTGVPGHIVVADADTVTEGTGAGVTVIGIAALAAVNGDAHAAFEVITTVTLSLLFNVPEENTALFVPTFTPFTFH